MNVKIAALGLMSTLGGGAFLFSSPDRGEYYQMNSAEVATRLANAPLPGNMGDDLADGDFSFDRRKHGADQVVWEISVSGQRLADFTANLEGEDTGTRVTVDFKFADSALADAARKDLGQGKEFIEAALRLAMLEHVDSTLERRPFDDRKFARDVAGLVMSDPVAVKKYVTRIKELERGKGDSALQREVEKQRRADALWHGEIQESDFPDDDSAPADDWGS